MRKALPQLPDGPTTRVFRACVAVLQADPVLKTVVRPGDWIVWDGEELPGPLGGATILVRVAPATGPEEWFSPQETVQPLTVNVDFDLNSLCIDDPYNFWDAVQAAFYPPDDPAQTPPQAPSLKIQEALRQAGAQTGVLTFQGPFVVPVDAEGSLSHFACRGSFKVDVLTVLG